MISKPNDVNESKLRPQIPSLASVILLCSFTETQQRLNPTSYTEGGSKVSSPELMQQL